MKHAIIMSCAVLLCVAQTPAFAQLPTRARTSPALRTTTPPPAPEPAPSLTLLTLNPERISGGSSFKPTGKVTLSGAAPAGGLVVALSSDSDAATVPQSVTVPAGAAEATFQVTTVLVATPTPVRITASAGGASVSDDLEVLLGVASVVSEGLVPGSATQRTYRVTMSGPAPDGGLTVHAHLSEPDPGSNCHPAPLFSGAFMPTGATSGVVTVTTDRSLLKQWYWEVRYYGSPAHRTPITVVPANGTADIPTTLAGGTTSYGTVRLNGSTPNAACAAQFPTPYQHEFMYYFSSSSTIVQVPASVLVTPGQNQAPFAITAAPVQSPQNATITVSKRANTGASAVIKQVTVTVAP